MHAPRTSGVHGAMLGGGIGIGLGLITGSFVSVDRWTRLELR
jgi:hypothetical protein